MVEKKESITGVLNLPMIPLRDAVLFPGTMMPFLVGRDQSIRALDMALQKDRKVFLATQRSASILNPTMKDLFSMGTVGIVLENLREESGNRKVLVEGIARARLIEWQDMDDSSVSVQPVPDEELDDSDVSKKFQELLGIRVPNGGIGVEARQSG